MTYDEWEEYLYEMETVAPETEYQDMPFEDSFRGVVQVYPKEVVQTIYVKEKPSE